MSMHTYVIHTLQKVNYKTYIYMSMHACIHTLQKVNGVWYICQRCCDWLKAASDD